MIEIKAPNHYYNDDEHDILFLAGSIEMGKAINWQTKLVKELKDKKDLMILNPRRDDWDSTWIQSIDNPQFRQQVEWELKALDDADLIVFVFDPTTKSPITLMELGLYANRTGQVIVYCPEGYWRKGNVDIVCRKYKIPMMVSERDLVLTIRQKI